MSTRLCGVEWYRTFTIEGVIVTRVYKSVEVNCGLPKGHESDHKAWVTGISGKYKEEALLSWKR